jgi:hypothetical protein
LPNVQICATTSWCRSTRGIEYAICDSIIS